MRMQTNKLQLELWFGELWHPSNSTEFNRTSFLPPFPFFSRLWEGRAGSLCAPPPPNGPQVPSTENWEKDCVLCVHKLQKASGPAILCQSNPYKCTVTREQIGPIQTEHITFHFFNTGILQDNNNNQWLIITTNNKTPTNYWAHFLQMTDQRVSCTTLVVQQSLFRKFLSRCQFSTLNSSSALRRPSYRAFRPPVAIAFIPSLSKQLSPPPPTHFKRQRFRWNIRYPTDSS